MRSEEAPSSVRPSESISESLVSREPMPSVDPVGSSSQEGPGTEEQESSTAEEEGVHEKECEEGDGGNVDKVVKSPGTPTQSERDQHNLTHWPYRNWCEHCNKGRGVGQPHRSMRGEYKESEVARVLMDYGYLHEEETVVEEEHGNRTESKISMTIMVLIETLCSSVWAYALDSKGSETLDWLSRQVVQDIETVGLSQERIIMKSDQEASMVQLQKEVARQRSDFGTAIENSKVGDSNSNGKIERTIREVKGLIRTMRSALEENIKEKIRLDSPIVPWLIRHVGYIVTRCRIGEDGKTAMQRIKGRKVNVPWVGFGEMILFKLPKVQHMPGDFHDRFESGIWLGCTIRSGEHLVGTSRGVYKVSSVLRKAEDRRWSASAFKDLKGSPVEPVPGSGSSKITAFSKKRDTETAKESVVYAPAPAREEPELRVAYIYKKDVVKYGPTPGCAGCRAAMNPTGNFRAKHSQECRARFEEELKKTEEGKKRFERAEERMDNAVARKFEDIIEEKDADKKESGEAGKDDDMQEDKNEGNEAGGAGERARASGEPSAESEGEQQMQEDGAELEEAPGRKKDKRVPLAHREPAQKRERESNSPRESAKYQAFEKQTNKRKSDGSPDGEDQAKWKVVEVESDKPSDNLEKDAEKNVNAKPKTAMMSSQDMIWRDIGSGTVARSFRGAKKLQVSTQGGPPECDVYRRIVQNLDTGKIIDDCIIDDTPDEVLYRDLDKETNIRVELVLRGALALYERKGTDVSEIFSPPRIAQEAGIREYGGTRLKPGWSLDLTRNDPKTGEPWDLSDKKVQSRIVKLVAEGRPLFIIGSPPCTAFSIIQNINKERRDEKKVQKELEEAKEHIRFSIKLYRMQLEGNRFFVHEHPVAATSWQMKEIIELMMEDGVGVTTFDMCQFGMVATKDGKEGPVQKTTRIMSNSREVLKRINVRCPNKGGPGERHQHVVLEGGLTRKAQVYPKAFCKTICEAVAAEKRLRALGLVAWSLEDMELAIDSLQQDKRYGDNPGQELHEDELSFDAYVAQDDVSGEPLEPKLVKVARREEIQYFKDMNVYRKVPIEECWKETGANPIGVRWVDVNKGDTANPNYRSRLVAKEYKKDEKPEWFAATPPSECLKVLLSKMAGKRTRKMVYADVSRAYFYAEASRAVYVTLPEEDKQEGDQQMCGKLNVSMYGTRDAATNWAEEYSKTLCDAGFQRGIANPCLFWNKSTDVAIMVHGDDFVAVGEPEHVETATKSLKERYKIKVETLGTGDGEVREVKVLNKIIRLTKAGLEMEADPRHVEMIVRDMELQDAKTAKTPGAKDVRTRESSDEAEGQGERQEDEKVMEGKEATRYRAIVARMNYIAPDRPDVQFAVKEAARSMATPKVGDWKRLTRIGRYLKGRPRAVIKFDWQEETAMAATYSDSDWAGCKSTGKSTSGGVLTIGKHVIKTYSRQQKTVALSSAEAELHAMVLASAETLGLVALCKDLGIHLEGDVYADSSAALGIAQRRGIGKIRHIRVQALWVQEVRCSKRLKYMKVLGSRNPSDILTKHVGGELLDIHIRTLGIEYLGGRSSIAPSLDLVQPYTVEYSEEVKGRKTVSFSNVVNFREVPAVGRMNKCHGHGTRGGAGRAAVPRSAGPRSR